MLVSLPTYCIRTLNLCVLCLTSRGLSTDDNELDLTNVNLLVPNLDLCTKVIQMSIDVLKADAKFFLEQNTTVNDKSTAGRFDP